jgi:primosomal protein N''
MINQQEFDRKLAELCADPLIRIEELAEKLNSNLSAVHRSIRRQGIVRKIGRPKKQVS